MGVFLAEIFVCAYGAPWAKPTWVFANSALILAVSRKCPGCASHIPLVGYAPCGRNWTAIAGPYWPAFARAWANVWESAYIVSQVAGIPHQMKISFGDTAG